VSNEELEYDIVKESVEGGGGKPNENKKRSPSCVERWC